MDPSTLLAQLKDIHSPPPITFWPLAPGWWFLLIISIIAISVGIYMLVSFWRSRYWKRQAKKQFHSLHEAYLASPSTENIIEINKLLKQVLSSAHSDRHYLQLHGKEWEDALLSVKKNKHSVLDKAETQVLSRDIYTSKPCHLDNEMLDRIATWIKVVK